jgi:hypothetical protein
MNSLHKTQKRGKPDGPLERPSSEPSKRPCLNLEAQIERASALTAQLRQNAINDTDTKTSATNQIVTEELMGIFESMKEKTAGCVFTQGPL